MPLHSSSFQRCVRQSDWNLKAYDYLKEQLFPTCSILAIQVIGRIDGDMMI
jgi:hypothetical protein